MSREEIRNTIFDYLKSQISWIQANPNKPQQFQISNIYALFPIGTTAQWQHQKVESVAREIVQELENCGFIYEGTAGGSGSMATYPWFTISEFGQEAILAESWLPYDPEGYLKALRAKVPTLDEITLAYISEAVAAYSRRHLLSATITLGVASENLMLTLVEAYTNWITDTGRQTKFRNKVEGRFISAQYKELKKELPNDLRSFPPEFQSDWETYLDGVFNFIRLNRNDAGHPTGKQFDAKIVYANLQIFAEYAQFISKLTAYLT